MATLREQARALKRQLAALFIAYRHPDTPIGAKLVLGLTIGYALSPIDLIPDFIPVLGLLDDLVLLPLLIAWSIRLIPVAVMEQCRAEADGLWTDGRPKQLKYAIPIVLIWLALLLWISYRLFIH